MADALFPVGQAESPIDRAENRGEIEITDDLERVVDALDEFRKLDVSRIGFMREFQEQAAEKVREGKTLSESLAETRLIPPLALEMIEVGEASGALSAMLTSVAEFYEEEVSTRLQRTLIWVTPAILVVMAVVVGFILISLYMPLFSMQIGSTGG